MRLASHNLSPRGGAGRVAAAYPTIDSYRVSHTRLSGSRIRATVITFEHTPSSRYAAVLCVLVLAGVYASAFVFTA